MLLGCLCIVWTTLAPKTRGGAITFSNTSNITVLEATTNNPPTAASPYPATITVTNLSNQIISKVTVSINNFSMLLPNGAAGDVSVMLIGPQGQMGILMSEVGGNPEAFSASDVTLLLDDDAADPLPVDAPLASGTFKPTAASLPLDYDFPPPVPAGNSNSAVGLSMFKNSNPSGTWSLYVDTDAYGQQGNIAGGWSLNISVVQPQLAISKVATNYQLSWPGTNLNFQLQSTTNIALSGSWTNVTNSQSVISNRFVVSVPVSTNGNKFFRLVNY
jgi:subtilisin-like proprotein convertase family protein